MYTFDKLKHLHMFDGKPLTGTTTVLQVIAKPMLIQWAATMAVDYIKTHAVTRGSDTSVVLNETIEEAKTAHRKKKESAGDWGTMMHLMIEEYVKHKMESSSTDVKANQCLQLFKEWAAVNKVTFLESELNVYSIEMWVGGICDLVVQIGDQVWLADVKTGSGIYPEHFWQMASYEMCLAEMGKYPKVEGYIVLNLKKDGTFEEKRSISNVDNRSAFKAALTIYRIQEKLKGNII